MKDLEKLKQMAKDRGLDEVIFTGFATNEEATGLYLRADVHLFPSICDNFGLTKVESASLGTPTLALKDTAIVETITDGFNGFVSDRTENAYADKMISSISDKEKLKEISKNAKETMGRTWAELAKTTLENTIKVLESLKNAK